MLCGTVGLIAFIWLGPPLFQRLTVWLCDASAGALLCKLPVNYSVG